MIEPKENAWLPIEQAPQDDTIVDIWCEEDNERHTNMQRVDLGEGNVFYEATEYGLSCVRNATHFMVVYSPSGERISG